MDQFEREADDIFAKAGASKEGAKHLWDQCVSIMSSKMASLSHLGLVGEGGEDRVRFYNEQREALIDDLRGWLEQGLIKPLQEKQS